MSEPQDQVQEAQGVEMPATVSILEDGERKFYVIGTAHVSARSVQDVEDVVALTQPDCVVVELCQARYTSIQEANRWKKLNIFEVIKEKKGTMVIISLLLASFQKRIGDKLGVKPGAEMMRAIDLAKEKNLALELGDRDVTVTLKRTWHALGWWTKIKMITSLASGFFSKVDVNAEDLEKMKDDDVLTGLMREMAGAYPSVMHTLIHERDLYLMDSIRSAPGNKIVAVVGAGHVAGIKEHWGEPINREQLCELPKPSIWPTLLKWGIPLLIVFSFVYGFAFGKGGSDMVITWILVNGVLAALGALIALAHPLTILTAFIAAPITSINPMVAAGWVSGLVEAYLRKPTIADVENLMKDVESVKGFYHNRFTRVLLVAALSNLGSGLGTFIAGYMIGSAVIQS